MNLLITNLPSGHLSLYCNGTLQSCPRCPYLSGCLCIELLEVSRNYPLYVQRIN